MKPTDVWKKMYDAFAAGDGEALQSLIGDTVWVEASGSPYGGAYRSLGEIAENVFGRSSHSLFLAPTRMRESKVKIGLPPIRLT